MPFIPAANVLAVEMRYTLAGEHVENTLYFRYDAPPTIADATLLVSELETWWEEQLSQVLTEGIALTEVFVTDLTDQFSFTYTDPVSPPNAGVVNSPTLPNNVALCISFRTNHRGRTKRGRNYVCGLGESQVVANTVDEAVVSAIVAAYNSLNDTATISEGQWCVVSRYFLNAPRTNAEVTDITVALAVDPTVDSQRRRLPGRGA